MSRQNKSVKKAALAAQITALHLKGEKGAKTTTPKHEKDSDKRLYTEANRPDGFLSSTKNKGSKKR